MSLFAALRNSDMIDRVKKKQKLCLMLLGLGFFLVLVDGCVVAPRHYTRPDFDPADIKAVAVLPFENFTSDDFANEKIRRSLIIELLRRNIDVVEPGEVSRLLSEMKISPISSVRVKNIQDLGRMLDVKAVIMGSVETFRMSKGISVTYPEVTINLRMLESSTGDTVWSVSHTSGGPSFWTRHFGAEGVALDEAASKVVKEALDTLFFSGIPDASEEEKIEMLLK
jgi:TolB-like protein